MRIDIKPENLSVVIDILNEKKKAIAMNYFAASAWRQSVIEFECKKLDELIKDLTLQKDAQAHYVQIIDQNTRFAGKD